MIKAIQGVSLLDFPGKISSVIFIGGCNFRCPFCHNPELVLPSEVKKAPDLSLCDALEEIKERKKLIDGVAITGGEPLLFPALGDLLKEIKNLGLETKVDTNGAFPKRLKRILPFTDYVAMDVKTSPEKYSLATGGRCNFARVKKSMELLLNSDVNYEFRTTLVPGIVDEKDVRKIVSMIKRAKKYALQMYRPGRTLHPDFVPKSYSRKRMEEMKEIAKNFVGNVELRIS